MKVWLHTQIEILMKGAAALAAWGVTQHPPSKITVSIRQLFYYSLLQFCGFMQQLINQTSQGLYKGVTLTLDLHPVSLWEFTNILIAQVQEQHHPWVLPRHPAPPWRRGSWTSQEVKAHLTSLKQRTCICSQAKKHPEDSVQTHSGGKYRLVL